MPELPLEPPVVVSPVVPPVPLSVPDVGLLLSLEPSPQADTTTAAPAAANQCNARRRVGQAGVAGLDSAACTSSNRPRVP